MVFVAKRGESLTRRKLRYSLYKLRSGLVQVKRSVQRIKLERFEITPLPKARFRVQSSEEYHIQHCDLTSVYRLTDGRPINFCPFCSLNLRLVRQRRSPTGLPALYGTPPGIPA